jgi:hypothetical protein
MGIGHTTSAWWNRLSCVRMLFLFCFGYASLLPQSAPKTIWTTDLLQNPLYAARVELAEEPPVQKWVSPQLAFIDSDTLAVSFDDDEQTPVTNLSQLRHFHFRTIFMNAEDGHFENRGLSWPTMDGDSKLLPVHDGGFVVVAGQKLFRYSAGFELLKEAVVPSESNSPSGSEFGYAPPTRYVWQKEHWYAEEDPSQEFIILCHATTKDVTYFWVNGDTLELIRSQGLADPQKWSYHFSTSKDALILNSGPKMFISRLGGSWQPFCPSYENAVATVVGKDRVFLDASAQTGNHILLVTDDCTTLMQFSVTAALARVTTRSASGNRIAISQSYMENTVAGVVFTYDVRVWNLYPAQEILNFTLTPKARTGSVVHNPAFAAALSPDGKLLAVLLGSRLMLYSI